LLPFFLLRIHSCTQPGASAKKGLGMALTATIILVLALLLYGFWDWLWHTAMLLALALLLYLAWPWLSQMRWDDWVTSWLQQMSLPQVSATNTPSGRLSLRPTHESRIHFERLGQTRYPRPDPEPILCAEGRAGKDIFLWKGRRWYLPHSEAPYRYLCVPEKELEWCWPIPPSASAVPCRSDTGDGWCYRSDS
jgi:hypothetical protein